MSVIDEIKDRLDVVEIISESVKLRKAGKSYSGFCPFHSNTRTPAFAVFPDSGTWRCFGACNEGGDILSFVMKKEGWDFPETLAHLAERAGIELEPQSTEQEAADQAQERLRELLESAVTLFRHHLLQTEAGKSVRDYLQQRGITDATIEVFELGYAPDSWDATLNHLLERGYPMEDVQEAGMVSERESGGFYDRFRHRLMFPIRDVRGRMAGFGARVLDPEGVPKYLNSPQTPLFDKGRLLYGLDKARQAIRREDQAVIVEGYMDVIGLHQAGFANAISSMGTALTEAQLRQLKRFSRRIVLALDADAAGVQATMRGLDVARDALDREADPVFNARGLVRHEGRLDADLRIVTLPDGLDPDEVVAQDPEAWKRILGGAQTIVDYVLEVLAAEHDLEDPKAKSAIARQVLPLIDDVANPIERETYRQKLARRLKVDERALSEWRPQAERRTGRQPAEGTGAVEAPARLSATAALEGFCLAILLGDPELLYRIDRSFQSLALERPRERDFESTEHQILFAALRASLAQDETEPIAHWQSNLDEALLQMAHEIKAGLSELDMGSPKLMEELIANFLRLRKHRLENELTHIRFQLEALQEKDDIRPEEERTERMWGLTREVQSLADQRERLDRALTRSSGRLSSSEFAREL
ncbi:MAG: DNA primase [Anaerolineales bacterium]|nr:MAG: DNA primase [Anaerolineales bacterium]